MTCARKLLISLQDTPYYHVVSRCVRRAWLWGYDEYAGKDYSHRKELAAAHDSGSGSTDANGSLHVPLLKFCGAVSDHEPRIPFLFVDYLELVDWTGRAIRSDKRGAIDSRLPAIMQRLNVDAAAWQEAMRPRGKVFGRALGRLDHLQLHARALGQAWIRGVRQADRLFRHG